MCSPKWAREAGNPLVKENLDYYRKEALKSLKSRFESSRFGWCSVYRLCSLCAGTRSKRMPVAYQVRCQREKERGEESTRT